MTAIYTIGHSTRPIEEFVELLNTYDVKRLVDIRTVPKSLHNPQFGQDALAESLKINSIDYVYMKDLGGLRPKAAESVNFAWRNASFRNYADYMQTDGFKNAVEHLIELAKDKATAIMCAEAVPWRCHRSLVGDALVVRGLTVRDIMSEKSSPEHKLTPFAKTDGVDIIYPAAE